MTHPEWALKYKEKGTELRYLNGNYYLYRITSKWDKEKNRARKITQEMIGKITEKNGLILKGQNVNQVSSIPSISIKEYGASTFL